MRRAFLIVALLYSIVSVGNLLIFPDKYQWDFKTYYCAALAHADGLNPYDTTALSEHCGFNVPFTYAYPPFVLTIFRVFALLPYEWAAIVWLLIKLIMLVLLIRLWITEFVAKEMHWSFYLLMIVAFNGAVFFDLKTGNISIPLQLALWYAFYFFLKSRVLPFCLLVVAAALLKLTPLALLPLLVLSDIPHKWRWLGGSIVLYAAVMFVAWIVDPVTFGHYVTAAGSIDERGISNPCTYALVADMVTSISAWGIALPVTLVTRISYGLIAVVLLIAFLFAAKRLRDKNADVDRRLTLFLALLTYALIMPRFKCYSYILLVPPTFFVLRTYVKSRAVYIGALLLFAIGAMTSGSLPPAGHIAFQFFDYYPLVLAYAVWGLMLYSLRNSKLRPLSKARST